MIRALFLVTVGIAITAFMSACAVAFGFITSDENMAHRVGNIWARMLLAVANTKVDIIGAENVLIGKPQIFMANHQSDFDVLIVLAHLPGQFRWIVKKELFEIPIFGRAMQSAGYIEIDREDREKAMMSIDKAAIKIREGKSVMSFPEGTRSKDGKIKPFKHGMFYLAIKSGVPIVPISIIGAGDIMPKRSLRIKPGKITMVIDKPIDVSGYSLENRQELIDKVQNIITKNYNARSVAKVA